MSQENIYHFDYIIVGNGLAGLQLALALTEDSSFQSKSIALIDKDAKSSNDKTWCFWEIGKGNWDNIVSKSWSQSRFESPNISLVRQLKPYRYKMVRSLDFYHHAKSKLKRFSNIQFIEDNVSQVKDVTATVQVSGLNNSYSAQHVFDSRVPSEYALDKTCIKLQQHFKGLFIESETKCFNPDVMTVMDFRVRHNESTSFVYILPTNEKSALIEYTFFTENLVDEALYDSYIKAYLKDYLKIESYTVNDTERGIIPMTDFNFEKFNTDNITKIGTGGGWVKGSTGYSFKHTERKVALILNNLKSGKKPSQGLSKARFKFYDSIFLRVLHDNNTKGMSLFEDFYSKNSVKDTYEFLDEQTQIMKELRIMMSMYSPVFIAALIKKLLR